MMNPRISSYFFFLLLAGAAIAVAIIFLPFLTPLILAAAAAIIVYPLYDRITRIIGATGIMGNIAAFLTVIAVLIIILVPLFFLVSSIYSEVQTLYAMLTDESNRSQVIASLDNLSRTLSNAVFGVVQPYSFDSFNVTDYLKGGLDLLFSNLDTLFTSLAKVAGYALVFLLAIFYLLRDGAALAKKIISWSPELERNKEYIIRSFRKAINSVFTGALVVSVLEGLSTGLALYVFGVPAPALWGAIAAVAALVPGFGTSLVIIPAVLYFMILGNYAFAIGMLVWGYVAIVLIDHTIGPALINKSVGAHPFLVLLSVLGGLLTFGIVGFVMGPLILVFLVTLLDVYSKTFVRED